MKKENTKIKISHNSMSVGTFIRLYVVIQILLLFLYVKYGATFSVYGIRLRSLIVIAAVLTLGNMLFSVGRERNWISLLTGASIPVMLFETQSMWKYSGAIRKILIIGLASSVLMAGLFAWLKTRRIKADDIRHSVLQSKWAYFTRVFCVIILLVTCTYGKVLINTHYTVSMRDIVYSASNTQDEVPDYENSLSANIATVAKMDPNGGWSNLSAEEKIEVLQTVCRIECRYLGMRDSAPTLELAYLEEGLLGKYDYKQDRITLSYNYAIDTNASAYSICQVLCHEMYHRYQHYQVNMLNAIRSSDETAKYADLLMLDEASIYEDEMNNYIAPTEGSELSYFLYYSQQLERDADKYGNKAVYEYYEEIQNYFKNN